MTAATVTLPRSSGRGGAPARRAILRWAFRMYRREWRRQALILGLLTLAVAATRAVRMGTPSSSSGSDTFSAAVRPASRLKSWNT